MRTPEGKGDNVSDQFDPAAMEAVAKAIYATSPWNDAGSATHGHGASAQAAIAALSDRGWVEGQTYEEARADAASEGRWAKQYMSERDALRAALELIAAPVRADGTYNRCREACELLAREALNKAKGTP